MNTLTLNKVLLNARPLNMRRRIVKDKDFYYKVLDREFNFSITAGGKRIKSSTATIVKLKGNSVVWNQLLLQTNNYVESGVTTSWNDNICTLSGESSETYINITSKRIPCLLNEKWALIAEQISNPNDVLFKIGLFNSSNGRAILGNGVTSSAIIINSDYASKGSGFGVDYFGGVGTDLTGIQFKVKIISLTKMFGSGNEPTTIEEYEARKPIVADEYAYNEGEVIHMTAEGIKSVGDNAWDEEWENGSFDLTTGDKVSSDGFIRSSNKIKVIPNESYYISMAHPQMYAWLYDNNGNYINYVGLNSSVRTFNFGPNAHYINIRIGSTTKPVTTYNNDIMITLVHSGWKQDTDANYQPYWEDRLIFDQRIKEEFPNGMKKWDMVYNKNGKGYIVKGTRVVKMKDLNWRYYADSGLGNTMFRTPLEGIKIPTTDEERVQGVIVSRYYPTQDKLIAGRLQNKCWLHMNGEIFLKDDSFADAASFVASLTDDDVIIYELATPIETEIDPQLNMNYKVWDFGTEQAIANVPSTPLKADIGYHILKNNLELTLNS